MIPLPASASTQIGRLRLRGAAHAIAAARGPLASALQQASWPTTAADEVLLLRQVHARGQARELAARAAAAARELAAHAVDGWSPGAAHAAAVRFASRASLLACLARDLLDGSVGQRWYWQSWQALWQQPTDRALQQLLLEEPLALPTIVDALHSSGVGPRFWSRLGADAAAPILAQVARTAGWQEVVTAAQRQLATAVPPARTSPRDVVGERPRHDLRFLQADPRDPRLLLAALLTLWQQAPRQLHGAAGVARLCALVRANSTAPPDRQPLVQDAAAVSLPGPYAGTMTREPSTPSLGATAAVAPLARDVPAARRRQRPAQADALEMQAPPSTEAPRGTGAGATQRDAEAAPARPPAIARGDSDAPPATVQGAPAAIPDDKVATTRFGSAVSHSFHTGLGGLFYLCNFLALPRVQAQWPAELPGSGWRGLYELALAFDCAPDAALLEFLAHALELEDGAALQALPPCLNTRTLMRLGRQRYGAAAWRAESWRRPARVLATSSHLDLHFRLQDVSLPVRRCGLDLDPGWQPWLGRVVQFHYGSGLEPH